MISGVGVGEEDVPSRDSRCWGPCHGARVLVVDDDADMRAMLTSKLEGVGCVAYEATSGREALEVLTSLGSQDGVDLLLIDLRMPGPDGLEVLRELREVRQLPPAILMTAFAEPLVRTEALGLAIHLLDKPFTFEALRRVAALLILSKRVERRRDSERTSVRETFRRSASSRPSIR
jgi:two-component system, response regulator, stage 0 sporulation protein F